MIIFSPSLFPAELILLVGCLFRAYSVLGSHKVNCSDGSLLIDCDPTQCSKVFILDQDSFDTFRSFAHNYYRQLRTVPRFFAMKLQNCIFTYFDLPGRGEATRLALTIGGIQYEDRRVPFTEWSTVKPTTPWGSLPVLELKDGSRVAQQRAILRFVGAETGLYPSGNTFACAKIDELMDAAEDLAGKTTGIGQGLPENEKLAARTAACEAGGVIHGLLLRIDQFIASNGSKGHAVGDQLSIADLFVFASCSTLVSGLFDGVPSNSLESFPNIESCRKIVRAHDKVAKYYEETTHKMPASFGPM